MKRGARPREIPPVVPAGEICTTCWRGFGADLMPRVLAALERDSLTFTPQLETDVSYAAKISKEETRIDRTKPWKQVHDHIRSLSPFPGARL